MRTQKAFKNMIAASIYQLVAIVCGLITPRLILSNFGSTYNGVVNSATQFLSMINILTLGITGATRVALYKTLGNDDILGTSRIMRATKIYMRKVAIAVIAYALILCLIYPYISHSELKPLESAILIAIVSLGTFAQYFFGISNQTLLQADQASYITYTLDIIKTIANTILVAILISLNRSIYEVKLGSSIVFFITPAVMNYYVRKKYRLVTDCDPDNSGIQQRGAVAFHSIANLIHNNTDLVILTLFTDAKMISVYTVYYLVVGKIKQLTQIVTSGIEAAFGIMWTRKEYTTLKKNFRAYEYVMFTFTAIVFSCSGLLILPFIERYTSNVKDENYIRLGLAILITLAEAFFCIRQPYLTLVQATGFYKETKNGALVEAIINLLVSISLVNIIGINGVIIGTLIANIFRTTQFAIFISKNVINRNITEVVYRFIWTVLTVLLICIPSLFIEKIVIFSPGWGGWLIESIIIFVMACSVSLIMSFVFYKEDLLYILNVGKRLVKRKV